MKQWIRSLGLAVVAALLASVSVQAQPQPEGLVLCNTLGSQAEVENSIIGPGGTLLPGGAFVPGVFGNAFKVSYNQNALVTFPVDVIPIEYGTIEIWARLENMPDRLASGENPSFVKVADRVDDTRSDYRLHLNGNDGAANGGLCGRAGSGYATGTGFFGSWTYEEVLGEGRVEDWHHYALVWNKDGIPDVGDGTEKVAVFLDGVLESGRWSLWRPDPTFKPFEGGAIELMSNQNLRQGEITLDHLRIWNVDKTDFSDRFEASCVPPDACQNPTTLPMWNGTVVEHGGMKYLPVKAAQGLVSLEFYETENVQVDGFADIHFNDITGSFAQSGNVYVWDSDDPPPAFVHVKASALGPGPSRFFVRASDTCPRIVDLDPRLDFNLVEAEQPDAFTLDQNFPNPFNPATRITYTLRAEMQVRLSVYDALGREVRVLAEERQAAGAHEAAFEAEELPSGVYFYRLATPTGVQMRPMTLLK